jgi:hypothetical protein
MVQLDEGLAGERTTVRELFAKAGRVSGAIRPYEFAVARSFADPLIAS